MDKEIDHPIYSGIRRGISEVIEAFAGKRISLGELLRDKKEEFGGNGLLCVCTVCGLGIAYVVQTVIGAIANKGQLPRFVDLFGIWALGFVTGVCYLTATVDAHHGGSIVIYALCLSILPLLAICMTMFFIYDNKKASRMPKPLRQFQSLFLRQQSAEYMDVFK